MLHNNTTKSMKINNMIRNNSTLNLTVVGTGSNGNSYILNQNGSRLILDMGKSWKEVLKACEYDVFSIEAALITHEHG